MAQKTLDFFNELHEWSERKLKLLEKYLDGATRILGSIDRVYYVDGFAGRGSYGRPGEEQVPGSPLRAALLARRYQREGRSYSLRCINIEEDGEVFEGLVSATASYQDVVVRNFHGTFADNIDTILNIVGNNPVICFIDPFGIEGMDLAAIRKLIQRRGKTDIWIRFEPGAARRRDGWYDRDDPGAEKQFEVLCRVYGIDDRDRLHDLLSAATPDERKDKALQLYMDQVSKEFIEAKGEGYTAAYQIGSLEGESKYHLVFATASEKGLVLASDIVYGIEEDYQRELEWYRQATTGQMSMLAFIDPTEEEIFAAKVEKIQQQILNRCKGETLSRLTIHARLITEDGWFGEMKGPHLTRALRNLCTSNYGVQADSRKYSDGGTLFTFN